MDEQKKNMVHMWNENLATKKKKKVEFLSNDKTKWLQMKVIMSSEIRHTKKGCDLINDLINACNLKQEKIDTELIEVESRMVVTQG